MLLDARGVTGTLAQVALGQHHTANSFQKCRWEKQLQVPVQRGRVTNLVPPHPPSLTHKGEGRGLRQAVVIVLSP